MSTPEPIDEKLMKIAELAGFLEAAKAVRPNAIMEAAYVGLIIGLSQNERYQLANLNGFVPPLDVPLGPPADTGFNKLPPHLQDQLIKDFSHA